MNSKTKAVIVFFLLIIVGVLIYYIYANKDKNVVETPVVVKTVNKEYRDKEYVFNTAYSNNDIVFPYINLDCNNVASINFQIKNLYETNIDTIKESSYEFYINDVILSVVIKININDKYNYYTYNINMENGKEISFEEVFYKYSEADLKLKNKISDYIDEHEELKNHLDEVVLTKEYVVENSYNSYKVNALSNNVKFFLDYKKDLNVVIKIELNEDYNEYAVFEM